MKVYNAINTFQATSKTIVTLGTFDGVHIGHKKIIEKLVQTAKNCQAASLVLTFFPHPRMVLDQKNGIALLNTIAEKQVLLEKTGLDHLIIHPFDQAFSNLSAEEFVKNVLVDGFNIQKIIIGHDHRFGQNRSANIDDLIVFSKKYHFEVEQISAQEIDDVAVSSTKIRNALQQGNIVLANQYLGYPYTISGIVEHGKQLGRTIGFATANLKIDQSFKLIPKNGVYVVQSILNNTTVFGMMNIGLNPTVGGEVQKIEIHFFDFNDNLYDQTITISIFERLRDEHKFANVDELKKQLEKDKEKAKAFFENKPL